MEKEEKSLTKIVAELGKLSICWYPIATIGYSIVEKVGTAGNRGFLNYLPTNTEIIHNLKNLKILGIAVGLGLATMALDYVVDLYKTKIYKEKEEKIPRLPLISHEI